MIYVQLYPNRNQKRVFYFLIFTADEFNTWVLGLGHFRSFRICLINCSVTLYHEGRVFPPPLFLRCRKKVTSRSSVYTFGGIGLLPKTWVLLTTAQGENSIPLPKPLPHTLINLVI